MVKKAKYWSRMADISLKLTAPVSVQSFLKSGIWSPHSCNAQDIAYKTKLYKRLFFCMRQIVLIQSGMYF